jgi:hypothetical protein
MKIIHFIIVGLMVLSASFAHAEEKFNYGEKWKEAGIGEKMNFIDGYQFGYIMGAMKAAKFFMPTTTEEEKEAAFTRATMIYADRQFGKDMLVSILLVMDKLYEDPANGYIEKGFIMEAAIDKVRGRDISEDLRLYRETAEGKSEEGK